MIKEVEIPYSPELSKNRKTKFARGRYYTNPEHKNASERLLWALKAKLKGDWKQDKVLVEIFLQKSRMNTDVANYVDVISDCVEKAIGINDKFFSFKLDWDFQKDVKPYMIITVSQ